MLEKVNMMVLLKMIRMVMTVIRMVTIKFIEYLSQAEEKQREAMKKEDDAKKADATVRKFKEMDELKTKKLPNKWMVTKL